MATAAGLTRLATTTTLSFVVNLIGKGFLGIGDFELQCLYIRTIGFVVDFGVGEFFLRLFPLLRQIIHFIRRRIFVGISAVGRRIWHLVNYPRNFQRTTR